MNKKTFVILTLLALAFFCPLPQNLTAAESPKTPVPYGVGQWLPSDQLFLDQWMATLTEGAESANEPLLPVITKDRFAFVPQLPMTKTWTDEKLYAHLGLNVDEIAFIESMVRPMEANNE